jgi:BirA family transcriptional regulator, biotin operon repressor / biotin---[acetyl-CoA-carboxylase] ligase
LDEPLDTPITGLAGWRHRQLSETGSTNSDCLYAARNGDRGSLWITAISQRSGRGRLGRHWVSEPGNLYTSVLLLDIAPLPRIGTLPFVTVLALHAAISEVANFSTDRIRIKWPNDILIDGAKVSGLLMESETLPNGSLAIACGFGVNIAHHPDAPLYPTTDLRTLGLDTTPEALFAKLAVNLALMLDIWNAGKGFAKIREEWLRHAKGIGEAITVNLPKEQLYGTFVDIDAQGRLVFAGPMGEERIISAGDIFFPAHKGN